MNFLKFKARKYIGYSFSLVSAFALLKSDMVAENICEYLERQSKRHINNPLNSKDLMDEKSYIKDIVPKVAVEKYNFDKFRDKFFELIPAEKFKINNKGQEELENLLNNIKPRILEISVVVKQCKNIVNKNKEKQNMKELEISKLKDEEKQLILKYHEKIQYQIDCIKKTNEQIGEQEKNINFLFSRVNERKEEYLNNTKNFHEKIKNGNFDKLNKLRTEFEEKLNEFDICNLNSEEREKIFNDESKLKNLKENYKKMNLLHNEFKAKEIDLTKECLIEESKIMEQKLNDTMDTLSIYEQSYKNLLIKKNEEAQHQSGLKILKEEEEKYNKKKNEIYENKIKKGIQNLLYKFHSQVKVDLMKIMEEKSNLMKMNLNKFFYDKNLVLEENHKFLDGIYSTRMKESISFMKFIMQKFNTDNTFANKEEKEKEKENDQKKDLEFLGKEIFLTDYQRKGLLENLIKNYIKIGKFAKKFGDEFIENLTEVVLEKKSEKFDENKIDKSLIKDYVTKQELLRHFNDNKENIFFELFYNYDVYYCQSEKRSKTLIRFYTCTILSEFGNIWLEFFNPEFNVSNPETKDFVNQFKAVNYIYYYIKKEDYAKAYAFLDYIHPSNNIVNKVKSPLEKLSKTQIFCDIMEAHSEGTQKYKEEKEYNLQV